MDIGDIENTCFRDAAWDFSLLTPDNVIEYFSKSQFYDKNCNNEVVRMQTEYSGFGEVKSLLSTMKGVEYSVDHSEPPFLFTIKKHLRESSTSVSVLDIYYVIYGTVYKSPTARELVNTRLTNVLFLLTSALRRRDRHCTKKKREEREEGYRPGQVHSSRIAGLANSYSSDFLRLPDRESQGD